jgi:hypothetical protein
MHVQDARRFLDDVMMDRRLFDTTFLEFGEDRCQFVVQQHQVAHRDGASPMGFERDPGS